MGATFLYAGVGDTGKPLCRNFKQKTTAILGFEVKKQHFLIVKGLSPCPIISMVCSCV